MPIKGIQQFMLGSVMNNEAQTRDTLRAIRQAGYEGIELCNFMTHPTGLMVRLLTRAAGMPTGSGGKLLRHDMLLGNIAAEVRVKPCQPFLFRDALCILPCSNDLCLCVHFTANIRVMPGRAQFIIRYLTG